jgi:quercetin dioxygenase-like cupin family protein
MTLFRSPDLQSFLAMAEAAIRQRSGVDGPVRVASDRIFAALKTPSVQGPRSGAARLPVCRHLGAALESLSPQAGPVRALADAFAVIEPQLSWKVRPGAEAHGEAFLRGHANTTIVGSEGLEIRGDVWIGASLLAPHTQYPNHRHPPEEIYVVMSDGQWRQANDPWHEPGSGGLVYNPPNIVHAMRSAERPLFAVWFLWTEQNTC